MAVEFFMTRKFSVKSKALLAEAIAIIDEYVADGYDLSLRQLYYQLVARAKVKNSQKSYKRLGDLIGNARESGLIDWDVIEDRGRTSQRRGNWKDPSFLLSAACEAFRIDKWADQPWHVEVMSEKDAATGVLLPVCEALDVHYSANKGYSSKSQMYRVAKRVQRKIGEGRRVLILYLGDHDPSGIDMTRDVGERLELYSWNKISLDRLALNIDQVDLWKPPPNVAKLTDSRAKVYIAEFGEESWELDAVEPRELARLVESAVLGVLDGDLWDAAVERENDMRTGMVDFVNRYPSAR